MQGKVLANNQGGGVILGDDGERYVFDNGEWKDERPGRNGQEVDFVPVENQATEIYGLGSAQLGGDLAEEISRARDVIGQQLSSPQAEKVTSGLIETFKAKPWAISAGAVLFGSLFLTFAEMGPIESSLIGLNFELSDYREMVDRARRQIQSADSGLLGDIVREQQGAVAGLSAMLTAAWLLLLVPMSAAGVLWKSFKGQRSKLLELGLGASSLYAGAWYAIAYRGMAESMPFGSGALVGSQFSFGFGGWIILLGGVAALFFMVRRSNAVVETADG